jgi:hypothetical protein
VPGFAIARQEAIHDISAKSDLAVFPLMATRF